MWERFSGAFRARPDDLPALTGIRGVAALTVVCHHACFWARGGAPRIAGAWAVDLFFVLSGFIIARSYLSQDRVDWRRFYAARFARVYPLYALTTLLMLAFACALPATLPTPRLGLALSLRHLLLLTSMPILGGGPIWNDPTWSISVESWTYALFPLLALIGRPRRVIFAIVTAGVLVLTAILASGAVGPRNEWMALSRSVIGFAAGWAAFNVYRDGIRLPAWLTDLIALACAASVLLVGGLLEREPWPMLPALPFLVLGLATGGSRAERFLASPIVHALGVWSYSIYLIHPAVLTGVSLLFRRHFGNHALPWIVVTVPLTLLVSVPIYELFEKPMRDRVRRAIEGRRDKPEPVATEVAF